MIEMPNMFLIAGNARKIGKTTLACRIIEKFSADHKITGLKVSSIRPDEEAFHGDHMEILIDTYRVEEEMSTLSTKDTAKMLRSGAEKVFYIQAFDDHLHEAAIHLAGLIPSGHLVVCESGSLRKVIKPGIFVFLHTDESSRDLKKNKEIGSLADFTVKCFSGIDATLELMQKVTLSNNRWIINN